MFSLWGKKFSGNDAVSLHKNRLDLGQLYSISPILDVYDPPNKRARLSSPFFPGESELESNNKPSIEILPDDCLFEIFRRLPAGKDRTSCVSVSKRWLKVLTSIPKYEFSDSEEVEMFLSEDGDDNWCHSRCLEGKIATDLRLAAISVGASGFGGLNKISVRGSNCATDFGLSAIARACPSLRTVSLWDMSCVGDNGFLEVARECHMLEKLDLCKCPLVSEKGLIAIAQNCPNLTTLNLESCSNVGNEALKAIGKCCPKLESVSIKDCPLIGDRGVSSLVLSASSVLKNVMLQGLNITDISLAVVGHYGKAIANLVLGNLSNVTERGFWVMGNARGLKMLKSLGITYCPGITDLSLEAIGNGCPNLRQICLRKCCFVSDSGLLAFSKVVVALKSLQLEECKGITQSGIMDVLTNSGTKLKRLSLVKCVGIKDAELEQPVICSSCNSLRSLSVRNCPGFGNAGLAALGKLCPQVQHLDLSGLYGITDSAILPLIEKNKSGLVNVNLTGCFNLTNKVIISLVKLHCKTLEVLNLEGCRRITDESLAAIAENCMFLSDLHISKCEITDSGVAALARADKKLNLQVVSLSGCSQVSAKSVVFLKRLGRTLLGLNIKGCILIGNGHVERLKERLWRCDILS